MSPSFPRNGQAGFSLIEMIIALTVMLVLTGAVFSLMRGSMVISSTAYELTDAQENLRFAQEFINRDLMNAGDGLQSVSKIQIPQNFVTNYLTLNPIIDAADGMPNGIVNVGILTSDNQVPAGTVVLGAFPATTVKQARIATRCLRSTQRLFRSHPHRLMTPATL